LNEQKNLLDELLTKDLTERILELEYFRETNENKLERIQATGNGSGKSITSVSVEARLQKSDASLGELQMQLEVLQECLDRSNVLPASALLPTLHRRRFESCRKASGWRPEVGAADILARERAALQIMGFGGPTATPVLQQVCSVGRKPGALANLRNAQATAENQPQRIGNWEPLKRAIRVAEDAGVDDESVMAANAAVVRGQMWCAVQTGNTREALMSAIRAAKQANFEDDEVRQMEQTAESRIAQLEQINEAKRKLRIAVSWVTVNNLEKLRKAIAEARELGVDDEDISKAETELASVLTKEQAKSEPASAVTSEGGLSVVLRRAKPNWTTRDLDAALVKLAVIDVVTVEGLSSAIDADDPIHNLNERLRRAGQRAFVEDTIKALRTALMP